MLTLTWDIVVSLALICSFTRMRNYLNLGDEKPDSVPKDVVKAVAEVLRNSAALKVSEDGELISLYGYCVLVVVKYDAEKRVIFWHLRKLKYNLC